MTELTILTVDDPGCSRASPVLLRRVPILLGHVSPHAMMARLMLLQDINNQAIEDVGTGANPQNAKTIAYWWLS